MYTSYLFGHTADADAEQEMLVGPLYVLEHTKYLFEHAIFFCISFNMLDSAGPSFNMLFHSLNMPFFPAAIAMLAW